ncbi:MAG: AAA-like domain-containing protein [Leptolyngbya sp. Prado105]|jgi:hypothetical protein|nr:AAA-like domain-containing protein [Leptolyngbya sp. Prado105]
MLYAPFVSRSVSEVESALNTVNSLISAKTGKYLSTLQTAIFRGAWQGQKYEEIAEALCISETHIKMVGADLWKLLSLGLEERVTKKTFRAALERKSRLSSASTLLRDVSKSAVLLREASEPPDGQIKLDSRFYIQRPIVEQVCYQTIEQPGTLIQLKAPRRTGKTALMSRILYHSSLQGYHTIALNLQLVDRRTWQSSEYFLQWLCISLSKELDLPYQFEQHWDERFGSKMNCHHYVKHHLLPQTERPIVIALDEVDVLLQHSEIAEDLFALLQNWHELAENRSEWGRLRFILVHCPSEISFSLTPLKADLSIETTSLIGDTMLRFSASSWHNLEFHHRITPPQSRLKLPEFVPNEPAEVQLLAVLQHDS